MSPSGPRVMGLLMREMFESEGILGGGTGSREGRL